MGFRNELQHKKNIVIDYLHDLVWVFWYYAMRYQQKYDKYMIRNLCPCCKKKFWFIRIGSVNDNNQTEWYKPVNTVNYSYCPNCSEKIKETMVSKKLRTMWFFIFIPWIFLFSSGLLEATDPVTWLYITFILIFTIYQGKHSGYEKCS